MYSRCRSISSWTRPITSPGGAGSAGLDIDVHDIPYGDRNIWGATAGMLMTLRRMLLARGAESQ